jgi:hypothetical protein
VRGLDVRTLSFSMDSWMSMKEYLLRSIQLAIKANDKL